MESVRQMLGAIYVALANAAGEGVIEDANKILDEAISSGAVDDIYARSALRTLVRATKTSGSRCGARADRPQFAKLTDVQAIRPVATTTIGNVRRPNDEA